MNMREKDQSDIQLENIQKEKESIICRLKTDRLSQLCRMNLERRLNNLRIEEKSIVTKVARGAPFFARSKRKSPFFVK